MEVALSSGIPTKNLDDDGAKGPCNGPAMNTMSPLCAQSAAPVGLAARAHARHVAAPLCLAGARFDSGFDTILMLSRIIYYLASFCHALDTYPSISVKATNITDLC